MKMPRPFERGIDTLEAIFYAAFSASNVSGGDELSECGSAATAPGGLKSTGALAAGSAELEFSGELSAV
jgi:hypothetical protein